MIITGICLAVLAAAIGTTSKQLIAASEHYHRPLLFHLGACMNIFVGPFVDASAYAFAPQVTVAPFACLDVIFNAITAPYTLRWQQERLTGSHIKGTICVFLGATCTSIFAQADNIIYNVYELEEQLFFRPTSLVYIVVELCLILSTNLALRKKLLSPAVRGISLGIIAGILMGNIFFMKGVIGLIQTTASTGNYEAWLRPTPYILGACAGGGAIVGHLFMRKGLGEYKGVFMVTIFEGAHITAGCLSGCIVMEEMAGAPWWRYCMYWLSVCFIIVGMLIINKRSADAQIKGDQPSAGGGQKFHIAQSFVEEAAEEDHLELNPHRFGRQQCRLRREPLGGRHSAENESDARESPLGRSLEDHGLDAVDISERGGGKLHGGPTNGSLEHDLKDFGARWDSTEPGADRRPSISGTVSNGAGPYDSPRDR